MFEHHKGKIIAIVLLVVLIAVVFFIIRALTTEKVVSDADSVLVNTEESAVFYSRAGEVVDFDNFEDKVRVINSWASWSPFSKDELQMLDRLASEYSAKGVVFLAINRNEPAGRMEAFLNTLPELNNIEFILDKNDKLYEAFAGYTMPETIFYDQEGNTIFHKRGALTEEEVRGVLDKALVQ